MQKILAEAKPEAAYFGDRDGHRGGILVVNMENASQVPSLAEPGSWASTPMSNSAS